MEGMLAVGAWGLCASASRDRSRQPGQYGCLQQYGSGRRRPIRPLAAIRVCRRWRGARGPGGGALHGEHCQYDRACGNTGMGDMGIPFPPYLSPCVPLPRGFSRFARVSWRTPESGPIRSRGEYPTSTCQARGYWHNGTKNWCWFKKSAPSKIA